MDVTNEIAADISDRERRIYDRFRILYGARWRHRKDACGRYNCFGHLFASRRTSIRADSEVRKIRGDDLYRDLRQGEEPVPGDIVIYSDSADKMLIHGGLITDIEPLLDAQSRPIKAAAGIPLVLSKWDDKSGEDLHQIRDVPFDRAGFQLLYEIWTDRP